MGRGRAVNLIECRGLTRRYGEHTAVDGLSLQVAQGELYGFLGPNGAGKTTTIKMCVGLLRPTEGECLVGGHDVQKQPIEARRLLAYIPDNPFLYEKLTGREMLDFMADLYGMERRGRRERIEELLHLFELEEKGDELIQGYSRGMRQKMALAGALIHEPQALFLDEPTVGLDPRGARHMQTALRELCDSGKAVFISTHSLGVAERLCDRVGIINRGKLLAEGAPEMLRRNVSQSLEEAFLEMTADADRTGESF